MVSTRTLFAALLVTVVFNALPARGQPLIHVIGTGGTISGGVDSSGRARSLGAADLVAMIRSLKDRVTIAEEDLVTIGSSSMTPAIQFRLASRVNELFRTRPDLTGVVITHGTDSLEETAFMLDLLIDDPRPVVFAAAQRPPRVSDSDGPRNLEGAVRVAMSPAVRGMGTLVVLNEDIHSARYVTKSHSVGVESFQSGKKGMVGTVDEGRVVLYNTPLNRIRIPSRAPEPLVELIRLSVGDEGRLIRAAVAGGARGLVIEAFGRGNMPRPVSEALSKAREAGVTVVVVSRTAEGRVALQEPALREGLIDGEDLDGLKARVLLMLALGATSDPTQIQKWFRMAGGNTEELIR